MQLKKKIQYLRLHNDIKRRDRLVANEKLGAQAKRPRNGHALALASAHLVREPAEEFGRQLDTFQDILESHPGSWHGLAMHEKGLGQYLPDIHPGVERKKGMLEHRLHLSSESLPLFAGKIVHATALKKDLPAIRRQKPQEQLRKRRLARPRLPHDPERFSRFDR